MFQEKACSLAANMLQLKAPSTPLEPQLKAPSMPLGPQLKAPSIPLEMRSIVAGDPATPTHILETLSHDQNAQVRLAVAENPNTPWQTLAQLAWEFPHAFLHNPVGPLQMVVHPEQISTDSTFWNVLLQETPIPALWWSWLLSHPALSQSQAMRLHIQSIGEVAHPYGAFQEGKEDILLTLVKLLTTASAQGAPLPPLSDARADQSAVTWKQRVIEHLQRLAHCPDIGVRRQVARNELTPIEALTTLAQDKAAIVRCEVAENVYTPPETLARLARDEDWNVREFVARNERTPAEALRWLAWDESDNWNLRKFVARNERMPIEILQTLAVDGDWITRQAVARNPQTSEELLALLALDKDSDVRIAVAEHQRTPAKVLAKLALDEDSDVRWYIACNERTPAEILAMLAQDQKWAVAGNGQTPAEVLTILAQDEATDVRREVAGNEQTPTEVLQALALDKERRVRMAVIESKQTPPEIIQILAQDEDKEIRACVAGHPQTPEKVLAKLAQSREADIRRLANLIQKLLVECKIPWWSREEREPFKEIARITRASLKEQLEQISRLKAPDAVRQAILNHLAADWNATMVRAALFEGDWWKHIPAAFMSPLALQQLAASPSWEVRYLVALHEQTSWETRLRLGQDGNCYVRAMAQAGITFSGTENR